MRTVKRLTLDDARAIMAGAEAKARDIGVDMDIAITDDNGSLLMFHRMDDGRITPRLTTVRRPDHHITYPRPALVFILKIIPVIVPQANRKHECSVRQFKEIGERPMGCGDRVGVVDSSRCERPAIQILCLPRLSSIG